MASVILVMQTIITNLLVSKTAPACHLFFFNDKLLYLKYSMHGTPLFKRGHITSIMRKAAHQVPGHFIIKQILYVVCTDMKI